MYINNISVNRFKKKASFHPPYRYSTLSFFLLFFISLCPFHSITLCFCQASAAVPLGSEQEKQEGCLTGGRSEEMKAVTFLCTLADQTKGKIKSLC